MPDLVRAKDPISKHEFTTSREHAEASNLTILDGRDTVDAIGHPLPAKPNVPKGGQRAATTDDSAPDEGTDETPGDAGADTTKAAEEKR